MSGTEPGWGVSRPGVRTIGFVLKRLTQSACGSVALVAMPVPTRAWSSAMSTDTNSPSIDMFFKSKGWIPWRSIVGSRLLLLAQHHSKDPTGKLCHEWEAVVYYLSSGSNGSSLQFRNGLTHLLGVMSVTATKGWKDSSVGKNYFCLSRADTSAGSQQTKQSRL